MESDFMTINGDEISLNLGGTVANIILMKTRCNTCIVVAKLDEEPVKNLSNKILKF